MTIEKARKVIGLNIHNLDEKMQMAVATIMDAVEKKAAWKPSEEQMEALMLAIEGKCPPTSYMSRRLEDLYEGLVNTYDIQENYLNNAGYSNHEQPSEDLEEEIKRYIPRDQCPVPDLMEAVARHFHELGKHGKEPHFTKRNALFDKCVANCDPAVMKDVSDEVDDMLQKEQKSIQFKNNELVDIIKGEFEGFRTLLKKKGIDYEPQRSYWEGLARLFDSSAREYVKEQMPMPEDTVIFQKGIEEGKRLMMEDALEGYIAQRINGELYAKCHIPKAMNFEFGDKIKIIIIGRANDAD